MNPTTDLDLATLDYVYKMVVGEWEKYLNMREEAESEEEYNKAHYGLRAVGILEDRLLHLIWKVGDKQQEVGA